MKKNILLIILFTFTSCNFQDNINNKKSKYSEIELIGKQNQTEIEFEKEYNCRLFFEVLDSIPDINDSIKTIVIERIKNWNDPGDFHKISFVFKDKKYSFFNPTGWMIVSNYDTQYFKNKSLVNSKYFRIWNIKKNVPAIFLFGYIYASMPGLLSIISYECKPNLIFNDNYHLYSVDSKKSQILVTRYDMQEIKNNPNILEYFYENCNLKVVKKQ